jgi:hypothetical protein
MGFTSVVLAGCGLFLGDLDVQLDSGRVADGGVDAEAEVLPNEAGACAANRADCNGQLTDGCETDLTSAHDDCGSCANACAANQVCDRGACGTSCGEGLTNCSGSCVDTTSDPGNCGACAKTCPVPVDGKAACAASACGIGCDPGFVPSGGACLASTDAGADSAQPPGAKRVFVTSARYASALGGLSGADTLCNGLASTAGLSGKYVAWLSTASTDAKDRIPDGSYVLVDGTLVATSKSVLLLGALAHGIDLTEKGQSIGNSVVWTGTSGNGTAFSSNGYAFCGDWTSTNGSTMTGATGYGNSYWTNANGEVCSNVTCPIYCFEQ